MVRRLIFHSAPLALGLIALATSGARAATFLTASITHGQEVGAPPETTSTGAPRPESFGTALFVLNDAQTAMTMEATVYNLDITGSQTPDTNDNLVNAHIHVGALAGANAGVKWGFFGAPFNDNNPNDHTVTPFATGVGGTITGKWDAPEGNNTTLAAQLPDILAGRSYINFHSVQFGGGEIRGQIVPSTAPVPEPGTAAMLLTAAPAALLMLRRRKNA